MVRGHKHCFAFSLTDLPGYHGADGPVRIDLTSSDPIFRKQRPKSVQERNIIRTKCQELEDAGFIMRSPPGTAHAADVVLAGKKDSEGNWTDCRFCVDFRFLNAATVPDKYGMPTPETLFQEVKGSSYFTKIDLRAGFHQIPIHPDDQHKTSFWRLNELWCYRRMPFGLCNATAKFQRVMDTEITRAGLTHCALCFVDDLLVHSASAEEHIQHVQSVLGMLHSCGLRAHPEKSIFGSEVLEYLGHYISQHGLQPHDAKVAAIRALPPPKGLPELRSILGFINYYRCYVPNFAAIAKPLYELMAKGVTWLWTEARQRALDALKSALCTEGLALMRFDPERPTTLHTDFSNVGIGGVLSQTHTDGHDYMVACVSRSLNKHESNYSSYQGEMLAACWCIKTLRCYLHGVFFKLVTDHQPLQWLMTSSSLTGHHARWALSLQEYRFDVIHRPGAAHQNADVPSRFPQASASDYTGARLDPDPGDDDDPMRPDVVAVTMASKLAASQRAGVALAAVFAQPPVYSDGCMPPTHDDLLAGHNGLVTDAADLPPPFMLCGHPMQPILAHAATNWVRKARLAGDLQDPVVPTSTSTLNLACVASTFWPHALAQGITLFEPFGGMCAGLEMLLRNGFTVRRYLYCDKDPDVRRIAAHRLRTLSALYPEQLPLHAVVGAFSTLPQDIAAVDAAALHSAGAADGTQWLVVAGWECQDLSPAGNGAGLFGARSSSIFPLCDMLCTLQSIQTSVPPAFILENTAMQHNFSHEAVRTRDYPALCALLGQPVVLDAAQFGSYAHLLRNFWSNLAPAEHVHAAALYARRAPGRLVSSIMDPGRVPAPVLETDRLPFYVCNIQGRPREAFPTFCARWGSRAFLPGRPGAVYQAQDPTLLADPPEPTPRERERAMGYDPDCTAAPGVSDLLRVQVLGRCMDATVMSHLFAIYAALGRDAGALLGSVLGGEYTASQDEQHFSQDAHDAELEVMAAVTEAHDSQQPFPDIWDDAVCLKLLQTDEVPLHLSTTEHRRVTRRVKAYQWREGQLFRILPDGTKRLVPAPQERTSLITSLHESTGHFGVRRTHSLLAASHWWHGMKQDVHDALKHCSLCDRARAAFNARPARLNPLPIRLLFYRWHADLAGPFNITERGNKYVMICIEAFSKHLELVPLPDKQAATVAHAFLDRVISHFGCPAEVVTDQGTEYAGEFAELLRHCYVDHRVTAPNHPAANGLAERAVQTTKRALRKLTEDPGKPEWDDALPWVQLGYNCSVQESTKHSPYQLLHARSPVIPPAVHERFEQPINFDDPDLAAQSLLLRAEDAKRAGLIAGDNLYVAQHRDTLRYGAVRAGSYVPSLRTFHEGDFVYLKHRNTSSTLQMAAKPVIYRVKEVRPNGVVTLQGKCGGVMVNNITNLAPCHLPRIDPTIDTALLRPHAALPCEVCRFGDDGEHMLLCDNCNTGWHMSCLNPPLTRQPAGIWVCPRCTSDGVTVADVKALRASLPLPDSDEHADIRAEQQVFKHAEQVRSRHSSHVYDGRLICKPGRQGTRTRRSQPAKWGWLEAVPSLKGYYLVKYTDGSSEQLESHVVEALLMPEGTQPPVADAEQTSVAHASVLVTVHQPALIRAPDLSTRAGVRAALQELMPGDWSAISVPSFTADIPAVTCTSEEPGTHQPLLNLLDVSTVGSVAVLARSTMPELSKQFTDLDIPVLHAPEHDLWLKPATLAMPDVIVLGSGSFPHALDVTLPLAMRTARAAVCALVPCQYVHTPPLPRAEWLRSLSEHNRLSACMVPLHDRSRRNLMWLVVFASASFKLLMEKKTMNQQFL
jgi:transposase InsO family protein